MSPRLLLFLLFLSPVALAQAGDTIQGGNITQADLVSGEVLWHGVVGDVTNLPYAPPFWTVVNATPDNFSYVYQKAGYARCAHGISILNLLFSNSTTWITSLERGNLTVLDAFVGDPFQDGSHTLTYSTTFETAYHGTITGVPTTYTMSPNPYNFRMGYLNDQDGNLVFITPVNFNKEGFDGALYDFQLILPTQNGTPVLYYVHVDLKCKPPPGKKEGGGTDTPYYPEQVPPRPPGQPPVEPPGAAEGGCPIIELFCTEWGSCDGDGYRYMPCYDATGCSNISFYRVEKCPPQPPSNVSKPQEIITYSEYVVEKEFPCLTYLLLLALLLVLLFLLDRIRKRREEAQ